jgi:hypothetical protein
MPGFGIDDGGNMVLDVGGENRKDGNSSLPILV